MGVRNMSRDGVLVATIDDGKANALSFEVIADIRKTVRDAAQSGRPLVLAGREGSFCAGFDLRVMRSGDQSSIRALLTDGASLFREICEAPVPVIAACTGHALAGGALLLLCADQRVGPQKPCQIGLNEVRIGMPLPKFAVALARHRLAPAHLSTATMFGYVNEPDKARTIGYLDNLAEDPIATAVDIAARLTDLPAEAFATTKKRIRAPLLEEFAALGM